MKNLGLIFSAIIISTTSFAQTNNEIKRPPEWFVKHMEEMVGTWITDNKDYKNETEVWDAYGMEWKYGIGKMSLSGVLFGLKEGKRMADFWEFKTFWNPADGKIYAQQFGGDGTYGIGEVDGEKVEQMFYYIDGSKNNLGHKSWFENGDHITQSYSISETDEWIKRRYYVWKKQ